MADAHGDIGISPEDIDITNTSGVAEGVVHLPIDTNSAHIEVADEHTEQDVTTPSTISPVSPGQTVTISGDKITYSNTGNNLPPSSPPEQASPAVPYQNSYQYWVDRQKPVKERNLKLYRIIAILAIVLFFPLGIPSYWHAMKLKEDYYEGIEKGDLSKCNKRSLLLHKLLILSFTMCLFSVILILAIVAGLGSNPTQHYPVTGVHL